MAHNLNQIVDKSTGEIKTSFVNFVDGTSIRPKAWHGLGQEIDKAMTSEEALTLGG